MAQGDYSEVEWARWEQQNSLNDALQGCFAGLLVAVAAWPLAEFFTRKRRMALPSIILLLAFVGGVFATGVGGDQSINTAHPGHQEVDLQLWPQPPRPIRIMITAGSPDFGAGIAEPVSRRRQAELTHGGTGHLIRTIGHVGDRSALATQMAEEIAGPAQTTIRRGLARVRQQDAIQVGGEQEGWRQLHGSLALSVDGCNPCRPTSMNCVPFQPIRAVTGSSYRIIGNGDAGAEWKESIMQILFVRNNYQIALFRHLASSSPIHQDRLRHERLRKPLHSSGHGRKALLTHDHVRATKRRLLLICYPALNFESPGLASSLSRFERRRHHTHPALRTDPLKHRHFPERHA